jgi:hypothetical protein
MNATLLELSTSKVIKYSAKALKENYRIKWDKIGKKQIPDKGVDQTTTERKVAGPENHLPKK